MKKIVRDLMTPISEYVIVSEDITLQEALSLLKEHLTEVREGQMTHRVVLVKNSENKIIGKLGYHGFLKALDPKYHYLDNISSHARAEVSKKILHEAMNELGFWVDKLPAIKQRAETVTVQKIVDKLDKAMIDHQASLSEAAHQIIQLQVLSILVTENEEVIGLIRLGDLFGEIAEYILADENPETDED